MKVLVTGSNGFVGKYLMAELTTKGKTAIGIDIESNDSNTFCINIMNEDDLNDILTKLHPDLVIHLAGIPNVDHYNKSLVYDINFKGTLNLLNACVQQKKMPRFVFISSSQVYGNVSLDRLPIDESFHIEPINHYGASKVAGEVAVKTFCYEYGLEYVILRPFNHTGPGQTEKFVIPKIVNAFKRQETTISLGNIDTIRDYTDVRDVVSAYNCIIDKFLPGSIYNIASGQGITVSNILKKLTQFTGNSIIIDKKDSLLRTSEILSVTGNANKIMDETGWSPKYSLDDTLIAMLFSK
jgi:GDP-4-dehydro-6-deoxy-D-mannose reductase